MHQNNDSSQKHHNTQIPPEHQTLIDLLNVMRKFTRENNDDMMGMFNIGTEERVFVATLASYQTGDAFLWFVDRTEYFLYCFVNEKEGVKNFLQFPIERQDEFADALKTLQKELQERGNPVTIRRV